jgi:hypothetical protein
MSDFPEDLMDLAFFPRREELLDELAHLAEPEDWEYRNSPNAQPKPILWNYIAHTYKRLRDQDRVHLSEDGQALVFNTGLVSANQEDIFCLFSVNRIPDRQPWHFKSWSKRNSPELGKFASLPAIATYFDDPSVLVLDPRREIVQNVDHIIVENRTRFPLAFQQMSDFQLINLLSGAIENAKKRLARNYKTAIPQYFKGKVQLLLPICLSDPKKADLALVIDRVGNFYRASTCLTLDMAYNNARQLARPDRDWLQP